jgi:hypothetical protein
LQDCCDVLLRQRFSGMQRCVGMHTAYTRHVDPWLCCLSASLRDARLLIWVRAPFQPSRKYTQSRFSTGRLQNPDGHCFSTGTPEQHGTRRRAAAIAAAAKLSTWRALGNMQFIGHLYKQALLTETVCTCADTARRQRKRRGARVHGQAAGDHRCVRRAWCVAAPAVCWW